MTLYLETITEKIKALNILEIAGILASFYVIIKFFIFTFNAALAGWNNPI
ncbi:hypothetical protein [Zunongwangia sp. HRR-M8]|nr:hypothetical protein [Zunongwangia sp. HRR-M8]WBL22606.1 hypothetical protein PBT89_01300 [Zunongwangia sp. HRR-M8]